MDKNIIKNQIERILNQLNIVEADLKSARGWGIYDILAGGFFSSLIKKSKISDAENNYKSIQYELNTLKNYLNDFYYDRNYNFSTSSLNQFLDIFMDNIFSDFFTQSKINDSLNQIQSLKSELKNIYYNL